MATNQAQQLTKPILLAAAIFAAFASLADAAPLKAVVVAQSDAEAGADIFIDSSDSIGEILKRHWRVTAVPPTALRTGRKQFDLSDPIRPRLLSYPGKYTVTLVVVGVDGELDETAVTIDIKSVGADCPAPAPLPCPDCPPCPSPSPVPPGPTPAPIPPNPVPPQPPTPEPAVPVGEFGIAPPTALIVKTIVDPDKAAHAKSLADAADALAAQVAAGTVTGAQDVLAKFGTAIKELDSPAWAAAAVKFSSELSKVYAANKSKLKVSITGGIVDTTGWATLIRECAAGVRYGAGVK